MIQVSNMNLMENKMIMNTMNFYTEINIKNNNGEVFFQLKVVDKDMQETLFNFSLLEDAVGFVGTVVKNSSSIETIRRTYFELYREHAKEEVEDLSEINLTTSQVKEVITDYYGNDKDHCVYAFIDVFMNNGEPDVRFYLNEHVAKGQSYNTPILKEELKYILRTYAAKKGYELLDFKYIGGVHRVGYFFDEDTPHFDGIKLYVKKLEKNLELKKKEE